VELTADLKTPNDDLKFVGREATGPRAAQHLEVFAFRGKKSISSATDSVHYAMWSDNRHYVLV